jgi:hypothetical protein
MPKDSVGFAGGTKKGTATKMFAGVQALLLSWAATKRQVFTSAFGFHEQACENGTSPSKVHPWLDVGLLTWESLKDSHRGSDGNEDSLPYLMSPSLEHRESLGDLSLSSNSKKVRLVTSSGALILSASAA